MLPVWGLGVGRGGQMQSSSPRGTGVRGRRDREGRIGPEKIDREGRIGAEKIDREGRILAEKIDREGRILAEKPEPTHCNRSRGLLPFLIMFLIVEGCSGLKGCSGSKGCSGY